MLRDEQKFELGTHNVYYPLYRPGDARRPLKKSIKHVQWFLRVNADGMRQDNPMSQQQSDFIQFKSKIEELLLYFSLEGRDINDFEYAVVIDFTEIEKKFTALGVDK